MSAHNNLIKINLFRVSLASRRSNDSFKSLNSRWDFECTWYGFAKYLMLWMKKKRYAQRTCSEAHTLLLQIENGEKMSRIQCVPFFLFSLRSIQRADAIHVEVSLYRVAGAKINQCSLRNCLGIFFFSFVCLFRITLFKKSHSSTTIGAEPNQRQPNNGAP